MAEREQEFVEYVVKALVEKPNSVEVKRSLDQKGVFLELTLDPEDVGKVIGKKGATINAIRALLRVLGAKYDARYSLKVIEPEGYRSERPEHDDHDQSSDTNTQPSTDSVNTVDEEAAPLELVPAPEQTDEVDDIKSRAKEGLEDLDDLDI